MFSLLLLGEMGHQYINMDTRTITNVFMLQKIYKFSLILNRNDLHLLTSYLTELFSEKLMVNKMKK